MTGASRRPAPVTDGGRQRPQPPQRRPGPRRPAVPAALQFDPEHLHAMGPEEVSRLTQTAQVALAAAKARRCRLTALQRPPSRPLAAATEQVAYLGSLVAALCARRSSQRAEARRVTGGLPSRDAAIARAAASVLDERSYRKVCETAEAIIKRAERDLSDSKGAAPK